MATKDASFEVIDPDFEACLKPGALVVRLWTGARWSEGPVWFNNGKYLLHSDIPNNRIMRWNEADGSSAVFREPADNANGHTQDHQGRLISCEHLTRRVTRTEKDGTITVLADRFDSKRLNSPNDVVVHSSGTVWFTDPDYGIIIDSIGKRADSDIGSCNVYRIDTDGTVSLAAEGYEKPNGIAFSPDEQWLYVSDTGASHIKNGPKHIKRHRVGPDSTLESAEVFTECTNGLFDGFRFDRDGRLWSSAGDGVHCFAPDGRLIGKIRIPETVANVCFGGTNLDRLFICATSSLYAVTLRARGVQHKSN